MTTKSENGIVRLVSMPEAGGGLADHIDPYNARDGLEKLSRYLDDPALRRSREREISERFQPRSWGNVADDSLRSVQAAAAEVPPLDGIAAIALPRDLFLEISDDAAAMPMGGMDGALSAELICISGWRPAEKSGVRAAQATATIRFRPGGPSVPVFLQTTVRSPGQQPIPPPAGFSPSSQQQTGGRLSQGRQGHRQYRCPACRRVMLPSTMLKYSCLQSLI